MTLTRRQALHIMGMAAGALLVPLPAFAADDFAAIEHSVGGRLGVAVLSGKRNWGYRMHERFPMCSTFKILACGAVLAKMDSGSENLNRRISFQAKDVVTYSPLTKLYAGDPAGMTLGDICHAAMTLSDNTAANIILKSLGGPAGVTDFARKIGDSVTRLDRWETELNEAAPGDARDTTTPMDMAQDLRALVSGNVLSAASSELLVRWMQDNKTGGKRLRAGLPGVKIGDKTGSGEQGTSNDVAVIWPEVGSASFIAAYLTGSSAKPEERDAAIAAVGRAAGRILGV